MAQTKSTKGMANKAVARVWTFESSSGKKTYETLQYEDGTTSCNCMGWTRHVKNDGTRMCKHTRMVDQGIANDNCVASENYIEVKQAKKVTKVKPQTVEKVKPRRIQW